MCVSLCDDTVSVCVRRVVAVSQNVEQLCRAEQANTAVRKARICSAAGSKRERVIDRERESERETGLSSCLQEDTANVLQDLAERQ